MSATPSEKLINIMFICLGNICRSPSAEWVFKSKIEEAGISQYCHVESSGTLSYHVGNPADPRSIQAARVRGIDMSQHRGQQLSTLHLETFDYLLVMDHMNFETVMALATPEQKPKIEYFLKYGNLKEKEVPDPYHDGINGFEVVLDLIEDASNGLIEHLKNQHSF